MRARRATGAAPPTGGRRRPPPAVAPRRMSRSSRRPAARARALGGSRDREAVGPIRECALWPARGRRVAQTITDRRSPRRRAGDGGERRDPRADARRRRAATPPQVRRPEADGAASTLRARKRALAVARYALGAPTIAAAFSPCRRQPPRARDAASGAFDACAPPRKHGAGMANGSDAATGPLSREDSGARSGARASRVARPRALTSAAIDSRRGARPPRAPRRREPAVPRSAIGARLAAQPNCKPGLRL